MNHKSFVASVLLAATAVLSGCDQGQDDTGCVNGKRPDGTPCTSGGAHSTIVPITGSPGSSSETPASKGVVTPEGDGTVGGFGGTHAGGAGEGGGGG